MFKRKPPHPAMGKRVLINLKTGHAISGVVDSETDDHLMVKGAQLFTHEAPEKPARMDGLAVIDKSNVDWIEIA